MGKNVTIDGRDVFTPPSDGTSHRSEMLHNFNLENVTQPLEQLSANLYFTFQYDDGNKSISTNILFPDEATVSTVFTTWNITQHD